jgi:hypothetical protein
VRHGFGRAFAFTGFRLLLAIQQSLILRPSL